MPSSAWGGCYPQTLRPSRWSKQLTTADRIDVKRLRTFNLHFVAENAVNDCGRRVIRILGMKTVVSVGLLPHGTVFQANNGSAGQPVKRAVNATHDDIHFGAGSLGSSCLFGFLFRDLAVSLEPGIKLLKFVWRELIQSR